MPSVIAEVRGEGLLIGLRMVPPASEMVDELRNEKMITVAAGDNVVRLLPPLIIGENEIAEAVARIDRACARLAKPIRGRPSRRRRHDRKRRAALPRSDRHSEAGAGRADRQQPRHEGRARARGGQRRRSPARRWR